MTNPPTTFTTKPQTQTPHPRVVPELAQPQDAFLYYLALAQARPPDVVPMLRAGAAIVFHNIKLGIAAIGPYAARLRTELPALPIDDVLELPALGLALLFAERQAEGFGTARAELGDKLRELRALREPMLLIAEGLALLGLLPADRVQAIRAGTGPIDAAMDGADLAALYREYAQALAGKHPFTPDMLDEIARLGGWIVQHVTPTGGREAVAAEPSEAEDLRNRFWSIVVERHAHARKAGFYLFGDRLDEMVPPLQSRVLGRRGDPDETKEQPAPALPASPIEQ